MDQWHPQPEEPVDELAYMCQQEELLRMFGQHPLPGPQQQIPDQQQYNPFHPSHSRSSSFPSFVEPALPTPGPSLGAVKNEPTAGQPSSSSNIFSFGAKPPRTLSFSGEDWHDAIEAVHQVPAAVERRSRTHLNTQEHVVAERRRREKMQQQFVALATVVPDLTKTDKISVLGSTIEYVKQLEEKVKTLEEQSTRRSSNSEPGVFESMCRISSDDDASRPTSGYIPTVEASVHGDTVLLKICCRERRGVLVMVFSEVENHGLSIINTSVLPFTDSCLSITITAKIGQEFSTTAELINNLTTALRGFT